MDVQQISVAISDITPSPTNPRKRFPEHAQAELEESVRVHGILQPLLLRPAAAGYELVAGERRYRAAKAVAFDFVPALVRDLTDDEVLHIQIVENLQRQDLHPLDEADGYQVLMQRGHTVEKIAAEVGRSASYVAKRMRLSDLTKTARQAFFDGNLNITTALYVARLPEKVQKEAVAEVTRRDHWGDLMSPASASALLQRRYMLDLDNAPFRLTDADLVPKAGACGPCPKRAGNNPDLFGDISRGNTCTDASCFEAKRSAHRAAAVAAAEAKGQTVITGDDARKIKPHEYSGSLAGGYVSLDDVCVSDPKRRKYRQIVGKAIMPTLLENTRTGDLMPIVHKTDLNKILQEKGVAPVSKAADPSAAADRAKLKIENEYRRGLFHEIGARAPGTIAELNAEEIVHVLVALYGGLGHDVAQRLKKLWDWDPQSWKPEYARGQFSAAPPARQAAMLMQMVVAPELLTNTYTRSNPERMEALANLYEIDHKAIKRAVAAEAKDKITKPVAAKKAAAKKAPAKKVAAKPVAAKKAAAVPRKARPTVKTIKTPLDPDPASSFPSRSAQ